MAFKINLAPELWACSLLPEGMIEKWIVPDGAYVEDGDALASVRVEGALHKVLAPSTGWLTVDMKTNSIVDPGSTIGHIGA